MKTGIGYATERLDHLGIVAGVCGEIGLAEWLDARAGGSGRKVSVGTATVAMVLNGLGFSNRCLYLAPQFFANKPVERLLGEGIRAEDLNDDCLGRTLDWIYEQDPTRLLAGIARRAHEVFGVGRERIHVDTTSFSVSGEYSSRSEAADGAVIEVTYGYSRDHRRDLKQWMLSLAATGDVPLYMRALDGNSSDKVVLVEAVEALQEQLRAEDPEEPRIFVADSGLYGEAGRPGKDATPESVAWRVGATLGVDQEGVEREWRRRACFIVGTNVLDTAALPDEDLAKTYKEQGGVEHGFGFLKDPLFPASSVFVKKPERIVALSFIMVLCLLVYRLAEHRLRERLAEYGEAIPNQVGKPTRRPTMRWVFQLFEGIDVLRVGPPTQATLRVLGLRPVHEQILRSLGPPYLKIYDPSG